jgi:hypothetical protein
MWFWRSFHFSDCRVNQELAHRSGIEFLGVLLISVISRRLPSITPLSAPLGDPEHGDGADGVGVRVRPNAGMAAYPALVHGCAWLAICKSCEVDIARNYFLIVLFRLEG